MKTQTTVEHKMNTTAQNDWRLEECHEEGIFNASYMITAPDPKCPDDEDERIVICRFPTGTGKYGPHYENAKLIAAAPELLEALYVALRAVDVALCGTPSPQYFRAVKTAMKCALAVSTEDHLATNVEQIKAACETAHSAIHAAIAKATGQDNQA